RQIALRSFSYNHCIPGFDLLEIPSGLLHEAPAVFWEFGTAEYGRRSSRRIRSRLSKVLVTRTDHGRARAVIAYGSSSHRVWNSADICGIAGRDDLSDVLRVAEEAHLLGPRGQDPHHLAAGDEPVTFVPPNNLTAREAGTPNDKTQQVT